MEHNSSNDYHSKETKKEIENSAKKERTASKNQKKEKKNKWIYTIFVITFMLSLVFGIISNVLIEKLNIFVAVIILVVIILIGILFDMIGMSVVSCNIATFHSMASKKKERCKRSH